MCAFCEADGETYLAIYHFHAGVIQRSKGHSTLAACAYLHAARLKDLRTGLLWNFTGKRGVLHSEVMAPPSAHSWVFDHSTLWNKVECATANKRCDSQLATTLEFSLPRELDYPRWVEMVRTFLAPLVAEGRIADFAIHDPIGPDGTHNPHAHVMMTMNAIEPDGLTFGNKRREWNPTFAGKKSKYVSSADGLVQMRERWAQVANDALSAAGYPATLSAASLAQQGIDEPAGIHLGRAHHMRGKGMVLDRIEESEAIQAEREIRRIDQESRRIHLLVESWQTELALAKAALAEVLAPRFNPTEHQEAGDAATTPFAATPATAPPRIVLPHEGFTLPHESSGNPTPQIVLPEGWKP